MTAPLIAIMIVGLLGLTGLAVDLGLDYSNRTQASGAADSGALAGARDLATGGVCSQAVQSAAGYTGQTLSVTLSGSPACPGSSTYSGGGKTATITTPYSGDSQLIHVEVCWDQQTTFARVVGISTLHICGKATAGVTGTAGPCGMCILGSDSDAFSSTGSGTVDVTNESILINGGGSTSGAVTAPTIGCGGTCTGAFSPSPSTITPIADPLVAIPVPSTSGFTSCPNESVSGSSDLSLSPGCYNNITSSSSGQITLASGTYVIIGTVALNHAPAATKTSLYGSGVTLYFTCKSGNLPAACSSGQAGGTLSQSQGTLNLSGPTSGTYQQLTIFYDRNNTSAMTLTGTSATSLSGTVYAPAATLSLTGGSGSVSFNSLVVVGKLKKTGASAVTLNFDPNFVTTYGSVTSVALKG